MTGDKEKPRVIHTGLFLFHQEDVASAVALHVHVAVVRRYASVPEAFTERTLSLAGFDVLLVHVTLHSHSILQDFVVAFEDIDSSMFTVARQ